jgi:hypothetical protein
MNKNLLLIAVVAMVLSACGAVGNQELVSPNLNPTPTENPADTQLEYTNQDFGFSLHYPKGYEMQRTFVHQFTFSASQAPQGTPDERGLAWLEVERSLDQDAGWFADQMMQENANAVGLRISSSMKVIDGQQAYILEPIPGQDLSRHVFVVYQGFLYHLTFVPDDPQMGEAYQQMESLYAVVMDSLRFLPERELVPPVTSTNNMVYQLERALEARREDEIGRLLDEEFSIGNLMLNPPEGMMFERYGRYPAAHWIMDNYLSQAPDLTLEKQVDWTSLFGDPFPFSRFFPDQVITPVLVKGWGAQGADEAVMIIAHRSDGSLYWRDLFVAQGTFAP